MRKKVSKALIKNPFPGNKFLSDIFKTAAYYHRGQERKDGLPYIVHPAAVAKMLKEAGYSDEVAAAGLLHDVLEDTGCEFEDLERRAGRKIAAIVCQVTDRDKTARWAARKKNYLEGLRRASKKALAVACADKTDNILSTLRARRLGGRTLRRVGKISRKVRNYSSVYRVIATRYPACPLLPAYKDALDRLKSP